VDAEKDGVKMTLSAKKEIILSAGRSCYNMCSLTDEHESSGSLHTPQLLELSGIGNSEILKPLGIPCLVDLPGVGENLRKYLHNVWI
jgi:choline dehydrogenase-like flavoprotein